MPTLTKERRNSMVKKKKDAKKLQIKDLTGKKVSEKKASDVKGGGVAVKILPLKGLKDMV